MKKVRLPRLAYQRSCWLLDLSARSDHSRECGGRHASLLLAPLRQECPLVFALPQLSILCCALEHRSLFHVFCWPEFLITPSKMLASTTTGLAPLQDAVAPCSSSVPCCCTSCMPRKA